MDGKKWALITAAVSAFLASIFVIFNKNDSETPATSPTPPAVVSPTVLPSVTPTPIVVTPTPKPTVVTTEVPAKGFTLVGQNMVPTKDGWYRSTDLHGLNKAVLQARLPEAIQSNQGVRFTYQFKTNVIIDGKKNIKDSRAYPKTTINYTNHYTGRSIGSGKHCFVIETGVPDGSKSDGVVKYQSKNPTGWNVAYFDMPLKKDTVQTVVHELYFNSAHGKGDGRVRIIVDGVVKFDESGAILNAPRRDFSAQMVNANPGTNGSLPVGSYYEAKIVGLERIK